MPDTSGTLTQSEQDAVVKWLQTKATILGKCEACGNDKWTLSTHIVAPPIFSGGLILGGTAYPQVMLNCTNCAHTRFFNAVIMGIFPAQKMEGK